MLLSTPYGVLRPLSSTQPDLILSRSISVPRWCCLTLHCCSSLRTDAESSRFPWPLSVDWPSPSSAIMSISDHHYIHCSANGLHDQLSLRWVGNAILQLEARLQWTGTCPAAWVNPRLSIPWLWKQHSGLFFSRRCFIYNKRQPASQPIQARPYLYRLSFPGNSHPYPAFWLLGTFSSKRKAYSISFLHEMIACYSLVYTDLSCLVTSCTEDQANSQLLYDEAIRWII